MNILMRPMQKKDISLVSALYYESFFSKLRALKTLEKEDATNLIKHALFSDEVSLNNITVAVVNDQAVGFIKLMHHQSIEKFKVPTWQMFKKIGTFKLIKTGVLLLLLDSKPRKGELYIESIAVSGQERGLGIGKMLLDYAKEASKERFDFLTLQVIENNPRAKALYEREGFVVKKESYSKLLDRLSQIGKTYFMAIENHIE